MNAPLPSSLDSAALSRRLGELAGHERNVQVEFLLHLDEFDRRGAWRDAGFGSLWDYCLRALHLREGAAGRRIAAMRVLRRHPQLEGALRDGQLCLSTIALLGPVLAEGNLDDLVARAAFRTKAEVEHLVVSLQPRTAPKAGIRRVSGREEPHASALSLAPPTGPAAPIEAPPSVASSPLLARPVEVESAPSPEPLRPPAPRPTVRPVAADTYSLRVTVDAAFKEDLDQLAALLSHKVPGGDLAAVLREAVRCAIEKHGKRRGAVEPTRRNVPARSHGGGLTASANAAISAEVRRQVWKRDGGQCAWRGPDGRCCTSRWRLELDHVRAKALGGEATVENIRLLCRSHNALHAEQVYGREHMARFRRGTPPPGEIATPGDSSAARGCVHDDAELRRTDATVCCAAVVMT